MARWRLALVNQCLSSLMLLAFREFSLLRGELERRLETTDPGHESLATRDAARFDALFAALTVGATWSLPSGAAIGCWLVAGRGPGGRLLASDSGSGAAGRRGLRTLLAERQARHMGLIRGLALSATAVKARSGSSSVGG
jgi:hypothetical protein